MRFATTAAATALALTLGTGAAFAAAHGMKPVQACKLGDDTYLCDGAQMTLYTFDKDSAGTSNCYDQCAVNWPPLMGEPGMALPAGFSLVTRKDGSHQIAYNGMPLYLWKNDHKPGDMTGDGVKGVWHIARP